MAQTNIVLELFSLAISLLLLLCSLSKSTERDTQARLFSAMMAVNALVLLCDVLTWIIGDAAALETLLYFLNFLVFSLGHVLNALLTYYIVGLVSRKARVPAWYAPTITAVCAFAVILIFISLFNGMFFSYAGGIYVRGPLYWLSQTFPVAVLVVNMGLALYYRKSLGAQDTTALLSYGILPALAMIIQLFTPGVSLIYPATTLSGLICYIMIQVEQQRRFQRQQAELVQSRMAIMLSQIQPHFLYNSLTAIHSLCDVEPRAAKEAIADFSQYLRGNLDSLGHTMPVPFETELRHIEIYLSLEKMRFQDELNIIYDIQTTGFMLPSLTVQPLVENAVKYGVGKKVGGGTVTLSTREYDDRFEIKISDDGVGFNPYEVQSDGRTHVGIENVKNRLYSMSRASLEIQSRKGQGTVALISIPKERFDI